MFDFALFFGICLVVGFSMLVVWEIYKDVKKYCDSKAAKSKEEERNKDESK